MAQRRSPTAARVLVRHDAVTEAIRAEGTAWFGASTWNGMRAMRISVCNFRTTDTDVDRTLAAVAKVLSSP